MDRHRERGCKVVADAGGSHTRADRDRNGGTAVGTRAGTSSAITPARALWIYVKHRGVLNVEEFRRTNVRTP